MSCRISCFILNLSCKKWIPCLRTASPLLPVYPVLREKCYSFIQFRASFFYPTPPKKAKILLCLLTCRKLYDATIVSATFGFFVKFEGDLHLASVIFQNHNFYYSDVFFGGVEALCGLVGRFQCFRDMLSPSSGLKWWARTQTIYVGWQEGKSEGKGQLGWVRQRLSQTSEETPGRHQKRGG
jgi:hypothetical protein